LHDQFVVEKLMFEWLFDPAIWISLLTLTALEIVLGIDNVVFISIVAAKLPEAEAARARHLGLMAALVMRIIMLAGIAWIVGLTAPVAEIFGFALSWRDIIMLAGGLFLLTKGTYEIHHTVEGEAESGGDGEIKSFTAIIVQIMVLDMVFSLDSVITAVGMAEHLPVMIAAVVIAMLIMLLASGPVSAFIENHPTAKMLALSFLLLVGLALVADGMHFHIPRGYLYFAIAFSILVEALNLIAKRRRADRAAG
jgi:predicted tellurium resistance membrane protein TerC